MSALVSCLVSRPGLAQDMHERVEADTFFYDEPGWILGIRPAIGVDSADRSLFGQLGMSLGYQFDDHLYVGGLVAGRLNGTQHLKTAVRLGVFFPGADVAFGLGAAPGLLWRPGDRDLGLVVSWGSELRIRLDRSNFVAIFGELDLLFEKLGFDDTSWLFTTGVGYIHAF